MKLYEHIEEYAKENKLKNTPIVLKFARDYTYRCVETLPEELKKNTVSMKKFINCLDCARMLIDMHIPLSNREQDVMISCAILQILPPHILRREYNKAESPLYNLGTEIKGTVNIITTKDESTEEEKKKYYNRIQMQKIALLIVLADRGNLMGQLRDVSGFNARNYIFETRRYYFPMCIYAKENYPEIYGAINVLTEKMRSLIQIAEIVLSRYESRETELMLEIISMREENARLRGLIQKHKSEIITESIN